MENLEIKTKETERNRRSFASYLRTSVVGAAYRVTASFLIDAAYLTAVGALAYHFNDRDDALTSMVHSARDFTRNLDPAKLARITVAVMAINFADYRLNITEGLDRAVTGIFNRKTERRKDENE